MPIEYASGLLAGRKRRVVKRRVVRRARGDGEGEGIRQSRVVKRRVVKRRVVKRRVAKPRVVKRRVVKRRVVRRARGDGDGEGEGDGMYAGRVRRVYRRRTGGEGDGEGDGEGRRKRPLTAYNKFVKKYRLAGYTMQQVGQMWRSGQA